MSREKKIELGLMAVQGSDKAFGDELDRIVRGLSAPRSAMGRLVMGVVRALDPRRRARLVDEAGTLLCYACIADRMGLVESALSGVAPLLSRSDRAEGEIFANSLAEAAAACVLSNVLKPLPTLVDLVGGADLPSSALDRLGELSEMRGAPRAEGLLGVARAEAKREDRPAISAWLARVDETMALAEALAPSAPGPRAARI